MLSVKLFVVNALIENLVDLLTYADHSLYADVYCWPAEPPCASAFLPRCVRFFRRSAFLLPCESANLHVAPQQSVSAPPAVSQSFFTILFLFYFIFYFFRMVLSACRIFAFLQLFIELQQ